MERPKTQRKRSSKKLSNKQALQEEAPPLPKKGPGRPKKVKTAEELRAEEERKLDLKQKGRKRERWDNYKRVSEEKIEDLRKVLRGANEAKMSNKERVKIRNQISAQQARLKKKMEVIHLNKIIENKDDKINQLPDILENELGIEPHKIRKLAEYIEANWQEYDSDNSVGHWNLAETKEKQKKAAEKRRKESQIVIDSARNANEKLALVLKDRLCTKEDQVEKYQQNDEKDA